MRYYSTQRPVGPGTFPQPEGNKVVEFHNFGSKTYCEEIGRDAWGYIDYQQTLAPEVAASYELTPAKRVAEYIVYRCPDGSILLDWNETLWKSGYPAYPKHRCTELERGFSEGGMALPKLHAAMKKKYLEEGGHD
ncbi:hypothetical protein [uncultured Oscillibacter sp.]|jgi:hypothetical protein|uniref:defense against restriction DarA-related protein n=1 Tax=uncultured Oscillibacter sp. TaxID=876091 RepID=UPI00266F449B|nr:hypothetical protein [uncultured Oscillibacter sp.]